MLILIYLFALIVGAVLLGGSILLGGKEAEVDGAGDGDIEADVEAEAGLDKDVSLAKDVAFDKEIGGHGDWSAFMLTFLSLRFWTFFLAFFGLTGLVLDLLDLVGNQWVTLGLALAMGLGVGGTAMAVIRKLASDTSGKAVESNDFVGKTARVVVPFEGAALGKVRVEVKGSSIDLLASGLEEDSFDGREEVLIVEMDGSRARVARVDGQKRQRERE